MKPSPSPANKVSSTDPDAGTTTFTYDAIGQLITSTDAEGRALAHTYDNLGRPTSLRDGSVDGALRKSWAYDPKFGDEARRSGLAASSTRHIGAAAIVTSVTGYDDAARPTGSATVIPEIPGRG